MRRLLLSLLASLLSLGPAGALAHGEDHDAAAVELGRRALVTVHPAGEDGMRAVDVRLEPARVWTGEIFLSLTSGDRHQRRGLRLDGGDAYRVGTSMPADRTWSVYLRYGLAQAGYAGQARIFVPASQSRPITAEVGLVHGFPAGVPPYVQTLGYVAAGAVAVASFLGLYLLLGWIRRRRHLVARQAGDAPGSLAG